MPKFSDKGIWSIKIRGREIIIKYRTKKDAWKAYDDESREVWEAIKGTFSNKPKIVEICKDPNIKDITMPKTFGMGIENLKDPKETSLEKYGYKLNDTQQMVADMAKANPEDWIRCKESTPIFGNWKPKWKQLGIEEQSKDTEIEESINDEFCRWRRATAGEIESGFKYILKKRTSGTCLCKKCHEEYIVECGCEEVELVEKTIEFQDVSGKRIVRLGIYCILDKEGKIIREPR